jgi:hypothetical protein
MWDAVNKLDNQCAAGNYDGKGCSIEQAWNCLLDAVPTPPTAQPAPVQPVAWMHTMIDDVVVGHRPADLNVHPDRWMPLYKDPTPCQTCEALARTVMMDQTAHDTTPPAQRQWVEVEQVKWDGEKFIAKLKEKNNG